GWIAHRAPELQLALVERDVILPACELDAVMLRIQRLNDRLARTLAASGSPRDLGQQLEGPLGGAEIGHPEADVGRHDAYEGDPRKVVPLRDHLRADEDVDVALAELGPQCRERAFAADRIAVQPREAGGRPQPGDLGFDAFRAEAGLLEIRAGAQRTRRRHAHRVVAVMT